MNTTKIVYNKAIFIFRRDLRIIDNSALIQASKSSHLIIPTFFFDERQTDKEKNPYFSSNCFQFMCQSLSDLDDSLKKTDTKLYSFKGNLIDNISQLISLTKAEALYVNMDYTPFSIKRDLEIKSLCEKMNVDFHSYEDILMHNSNELFSKSGGFFKVFSPYSNSAFATKVREVDKFTVENFIKKDSLIEKTVKSHSGYIDDNTSSGLFKLFNIEFNKNVEVIGGRSHGLNILSNIKSFKNYNNDRTYVNIPSTRLSAYLKFGCISIRETYYCIKNSLGNQNELIKQLQWRDFYMKISYFYPEVLSNSFKSEGQFLIWKSNSDEINAWKEGKTGFPIVDSAMRCLNKTGYMHNRLRMMVCSFLVKDLLADWRIGEKYFSNFLVDYDISLNNGGWQWTASVGTDPQPFPRIYNPVLQSAKIDPNCEFIKKWIPELKSVENKHVHDWEKYYTLYKNNKNIKYFDPIVSHSERKEIFSQMWRDARQMYLSGKESVYEKEEEKSLKKTSVKKKSKVAEKGDVLNMLLNSKDKVKKGKK